MDLEIDCKQVDIAPARVNNEVTVEMADIDMGDLQRAISVMKIEEAIELVGYNRAKEFFENED